MSEPSTKPSAGSASKAVAEEKKLGGNFKLPGTDLTVKRMGYGAMQLAGPQVWGPPRDVAGAMAVLRERSESVV